MHLSFGRQRYRGGGGRRGRDDGQSAHHLFEEREPDLLLVGSARETVKKGEKVGLKVDFKRISIEKDGVLLVKPFPEYDSFLGAFTNLDNEKKSLKSLIAYEKAASEKRVKELEKKELNELSAISFQEVLYENYRLEHKQKVARPQRRMLVSDRYRRSGPRRQEADPEGDR
jgi:hypothetical protein